MRIDHVLLLTDFAFFALAIFFSVLATQLVDPSLRIQFVALSSSFFVGGVVIVIILALMYILKKVLLKKRPLGVV